MRAAGVNLKAISLHFGVDHHTVQKAICGSVSICPSVTDPRNRSGAEISWSPNGKLRSKAKAQLVPDTVS